MKFLCLLVVALFILWTPVLAQSNGDSQSSWTKFTHSNFSLKYPSTWLKIEEKNKTGVSLISPDKNILAVLINKNKNKATLKLVDAYIAKISKDENSFKLIEKKDIILAGYPGYYFEFEFFDEELQRFMISIQWLTTTPDYTIFIDYIQPKGVKNETRIKLDKIIKSLNVFD